MSFDPNEVWRQLQVGVKIALGIKTKETVYSLAESYVQFSLAGRPARKLIIRLNGGDLYDIQIGRMARRPSPQHPEIRVPTWVVEDTCTDVGVEQLNAVVLDMFYKVTAAKP